NPDVREIELALAAAIDGLVPNARPAVFRFREAPDPLGPRLVAQVRPGNRKSDETQALPIPLESDAAFQDCFESGEMVVAPAGREVRIVHPLRTSGGIVGFVVLHCTRDDPKKRELVLALLDVYRNYVSLLNESQRDALTGLHNRKTFEERMLRIIGGLERAAA